MAISQNFPNTRPSLNLNFARSKTLDPRITFSRTNPTATYVDDNGLIVAAGADEPRFDHDPTTGESLGLLVEEQRTNVLLYSEKIGGTFATYGWANQNSIAVQVDTADVSDPSGGNTASKLTNGSTSPVSQTLKTSSLSATVYTASVYLRTLSGTETASINVFLQSSPYTTIATSGEVTVTSEWQRFDITTSTATSANYNFGIQVRSGTIYAWGAQLEAGAFPTSYIPTSGSQATRVKDVATIDGTNFSDFYNPSEGSIYVRYNMNGYFGVDGFNRVFEISDGTSNNSFTTLLQGTNSNIYESFGIAGSQNLNFNTSSITFGDFYQIAVGFGTNLKRYTYNASGNLDINTDTSIGISTFSATELAIGNESSSNARQLNGHISHLSYYPTKLSDDQLQNLILQ